MGTWGHAGPPGSGDMDGPHSLVGRTGPAEHGDTCHHPVARWDARGCAPPAGGDAHGHTHRAPPIRRGGAWGGRGRTWQSWGRSPQDLQTRVQMRRATGSRGAGLPGGRGTGQARPLPEDEGSLPVCPVPCPPPWGFGTPCDTAVAPANPNPRRPRGPAWLLPPPLHPQPHGTVGDRWWSPHHPALPQGTTGIQGGHFAPPPLPQGTVGVQGALLPHPRELWGSRVTTFTPCPRSPKVWVP